MLNNFSSNMLKTYLECPYKFFLMYKEGINIPQDYTLSQKGKNLHALISYYLKGFDIKKLENALDETETMLWKNFLSLSLKPHNTFKSEYSFNVRIDEKNWINGRVDALIKSDNKIIIYDWKTASIPENAQEDLQTKIYLICIYDLLKCQNIINDCSDISFFYLNLSTLQKTEIAHDNYENTRYKNDIKGIIHNINSHNFPKTNDPLKCSKCTFNTIC